MNKLFSLIDPFKTEYLKVSNIHTLYLEQTENPICLVHQLPPGN